MWIITLRSYVRIRMKRLRRLALLATDATFYDYIVNS